MGYGSKSIKDWAEEVHGLAREKGWWDECVRPSADSAGKIGTLSYAKVLDGTMVKLCLIHSEVSEAVEAYRDGHIDMRIGESNKPEGMVVELADAVIRIMDLCEALGLNLEQAIRQKHAFNMTRAYRHGGKNA